MQRLQNSHDILAGPHQCTRDVADKTNDSVRSPRTLPASTLLVFDDQLLHHSDDLAACCVIDPSEEFNLTEQRSHDVAERYHIANMHDVVPVGPGLSCKLHIVGRQALSQKSTQRSQHCWTGFAAVAQSRPARQVELITSFQALDVHARGLTQYRLVPFAMSVREVVLESLDVFVLSFMDETHNQGAPLVVMLDEMHLRQHIVDAVQCLERLQPIVCSCAHDVAVGDASSGPEDRPDDERQL